MYELTEPSDLRPLPLRLRTRPGVPVDVRRLLRLLLRNRRILIVAMGAGALLGLVLALTVAPRDFTSQAVLVWDSHSKADSDPVREIGTLVGTVKTTVNLAEVRKRLGLPLTLEVLGKRVEVEFSAGSNLITLAATANNPQAAQQLTQTLLDVFLERRKDLERARATAELRELTVVRDEAELELTHLRERYDAFRRDNGITDIERESTVALGEAARLDAERVTSRADALGAQARVAALSQSVEAQNPDVVLSERKVSPEGSKLAEVEADLASVKGVLSPDHPRLHMLEVQAQNLRKKRGAAWTGVVTERSIGRNPQRDALEADLANTEASQGAALEREKALLQLSTSARERVSRLASVEGQANRLLLDVHAAEAHLLDIEAKRSLASDVVRSPPTSLTVLAAAELPIRPRRSFRKAVAVAVPILVVLLTATAILAVGLRGFRAYTAAEVAFWGQGAVVLSSQWPRAGSAEELALELAASVAESSGTTLVVPVGASEAEAAAALAAKLRWPNASAQEQCAKAGASFWGGELAGQSLRRAARLADRVLVIGFCGQHSFAELAATHRRLGREDAVAFGILGLVSTLADFPDREGDTDGFWRGPASGARLVEGARIALAPRSSTS